MSDFINSTKYQIKKIIEERKIPENGIPMRCMPISLSKDQGVVYIFVTVNNNIDGKSALIEILSDEDRTNIEAIYHLYGEYDFCIELKGQRQTLERLNDKIISTLESRRLLRKFNGNPHFFSTLRLYKYQGIEITGHATTINAYFVDFERANCICAFVRAPLTATTRAGEVYAQIKNELSERALEGFLFSALLGTDSSMYFILLAENDEYYKLDTATEIMDNIIENFGLKKTTFPIAGIIHYDANNTGYKMALIPQKGKVSKQRPIAFMSYAHFDDQHDRGYPTKLKEALSQEVQAQTGDEFYIYQDKMDISWGETWDKQLQESLSQVVFLISIITPSFFKSKNCRSELEQFLERERALKRNDLILPIYYIDCPELNKNAEDPGDELVRVIASRQYFDWRNLRSKHFTTREVKKALRSLAIQIRAALNRK